MKKKKLTDREVVGTLNDLMFEAEMEEYEGNMDKWFKDNNIDMEKYQEWESKCLKMINDRKAKLKPPPVC